MQLGYSLFIAFKFWQWHLQSLFTIINHQSGTCLWGLSCKQKTVSTENLSQSLFSEIIQGNQCDANFRFILQKYITPAPPFLLVKKYLMMYSFCLASLTTCPLCALVHFTAVQQTYHSKVITIITTNSHCIKNSLHGTKLHWTTPAHRNN